jgi:hypothetical protein
MVPFLGFVVDSSGDSGREPAQIRDLDGQAAAYEAAGEEVG